MPDIMTVYKIFVASPSDTSEERKIVSKVIKRWNELNSSAKKVFLKDLRWENDAYSEFHKKPQDAINDQLLKDANFLIGIFKNKFGSPTDDYPCATAEEIELHLAAGKDGMLFFYNSKIDRSEISKEDSDIAKIEQLKEKYKKEIFYLEYDGLDDFEKILEESLYKTVRSYIQSIGRNSENETVDCDKEFYLDFVNGFCEAIKIDSWTTWASNLCSVDPTVNIEFYRVTLKKINKDFHSIRWPDTCPQVKNAFLNFAKILGDLVIVFDKHALKSPHDEDVLVYERYYRAGGRFNPRYNQDVKMYQHETLLIRELVVELTKAVNYLCDSVRKELDPTFRKYENKLTLEILDRFLGYTLIPEYTKEELDSNCLYQGLEAMKENVKKIIIGSQ